ncbi:MAG: hypothetical protein Q9161_002104 [Pseudevernia consocians]
MRTTINCIKAKDNKLFKPPDEDKAIYFVVRQLIQETPKLEIESFSGKQPAFIIVASQGAVYILNFVLKILGGSLLDVAFATSKNEFEEKLFDKLKVADRAANTSLGLAVKEGHAYIARILLDTEKRLAAPDYLKDIHIKEAVS